MVRLVEREEWAVDVGRLLVAFGSIESTTRMCIRKLCTEVVAKHTVKMALGERLRFVSDLVGQHDGDKAAIGSFQAAVQDAQRLSKLRNLVAHNPLCLMVFQAEDGSPTMKQAIAREGREEHIDLPALRSAAAQAQACDEAMASAFYQLVIWPTMPT